MLRSTPMMYKTIAVTIGLALALIAVISAVPMTQQLVNAQAGTPGVGSNGGSGSSGASGGIPNQFGGVGTKAAPGIGSPSGGIACYLLNCGGGSGVYNSGGSSSVGTPTRGSGFGGNSVGKGGAP
jgi:hypothetical protein